MLHAIRHTPISSPRCAFLSSATHKMNPGHRHCAGIRVTPLALPWLLLSSSSAGETNPPPPPPLLHPSPTKEIWGNFKYNCRFRFCRSRGTDREKRSNDNLSCEEQQTRPRKALCRDKSSKVTFGIGGHFLAMKFQIIRAKIQAKSHCQVLLTIANGFTFTWEIERLDCGKCDPFSETGLHRTSTMAKSIQLT